MAVEVLHEQYVKDWWCLLDTIMSVWTPVILVLLISMPFTIDNGELPPAFQAVAAQGAITLILQYWRLLYYMRPFRSTGPLIKMVTTVLWDVKMFILIFLLLCWATHSSMCVVFDASVAGVPRYRAAISDPNKSPTFIASKIAAIAIGDFDRTLGSFSAGDDVLLPGQQDIQMTLQDSFTRPVAELIYTFSIFVITIIMTNLLIAILADSHARIQENHEEEFLRERASTLAKLEQIMSPTQLSNTEWFPDYIHYLYPREVLEGHVTADTEWAGSINRLKEIIGANAAQLSDVQNEQRVLKGEVRSLQQRMYTISSGVDKLLEIMKPGSIP